MSEAVVEFGRCLCIHSLSQAVDTILQVLLYQRQIIPEPMHLLTQSECPKAQLFKTTYDEVAAVLRTLFRSQNSLAVKELVILIGNSSYSPKEVYRIPVEVCSAHIDSSGGCGVNCGTLTHKEQRTVFSTLTNWAAKYQHGSSLGSFDKVFLFVLTVNYKAVDGIVGLEEDPNFDDAISGHGAGGRADIVKIRMNTPCTTETNVEMTACWSRFMRYFGRFT